LPGRRKIITPITGYTIHNNVELVKGGADYFNRIETIANGAQYALHLQTYIFDEDETGTKVANYLIRAAERNVRVYLLLDGYASRNLSPAFISQLRNAGVNVGFFNPLFKSDLFYLGRRLHHKIIVADASVCMVAGINISNRYNDIGDAHGWLDWAIYVEGEAAKKIAEVCIQVWNRSVFRKRIKGGVNKVLFSQPLNECAVRIRRNDWVYKKTEITKVYRAFFRQSTSYVTIMTGYFWPPQHLLQLMARAAKRGVKIKIILTAKADVPLSKYTERYLYNWLFRNNIEIYEYNKNVLHGKMAVCDDLWLTTGSYNMNNISAFASVELNMEVKSKQLATETNKKLQIIIDNDCRQVISNEFWLENNLMQRFFYFLAYKITHLIFFVFTILFKQRKPGRDG
jgi:cardiolipin synthase